MSPKLKRHSKPLKGSSLSCTKVPRPLFRTFKGGGCGSRKKSGPTASKLVSITKNKTSPTDSGISTQKNTTSSGSGGSCHKVIPPDSYYDGGITKPINATKINPTINATTDPKSDSGHCDTEEQSLSFSLENIESELEFSESNKSNSPFDGISSEEKSSLTNSFSSYTCSNSCCVSDSDFSSASSTSSENEAELEISSQDKKLLLRVQELKETLKNWDSFLVQNGIQRPDFFCKYKERQELEKYLNKFQSQKSVANNVKSIKALKRKSALLGKNISLGENWQLKKTLDFKQYEKAFRGHNKVCEESENNGGRKWKSFGVLGFVPETLELQKFWETEKKLQGMQIQDATSSNEAAHLQQKLKSLSTELVTLRNRLHVNGSGQPHPQGPPNHSDQVEEVDSSPQVPPHQGQNEGSRSSHNYMNHPHPGLHPYPNKPLPPQPISNSNLGGGGSGGISSNNNGTSQGYYENQPFQKGESPDTEQYLQDFRNDVDKKLSNLYTARQVSNINSTRDGITYGDEVLRIGSDILGVSNCSSTNPSHHHPSHQNDKLGVGVGVVHGIPSLRDMNRDRDATQSQGSSGSCVVNSNSGGGASGSVILGSNVTTSTPSESSFGVSNKSLERRSCHGQAISSHSNKSGTRINKRRKVNLAEVEDLIHLNGPLTEDAIIRAIQARVGANKYSVYIGPILLLTNRLTSTNNPLTLTSTADFPIPPSLKKMVMETLRQQGDTGYPQAIILSGVSGAGKTHTSMLILRQLFLLAGGGVTSDAYKHLCASVTVLRSLGTATTVLNRDSSRVGHFIELHCNQPEGTVYRTKVHCYFLDQTRVVKTPMDEKNYDIFYQMLAGLGHEERERLHLGQHRIETLRYLNRADCRTDEKEDKRRFLEWKASLGMLGIPFLDVVRVLAAVILMGNIEFRESSSCLEMDVQVRQGEAELQSAAALLGVSELALKSGLTMRTHNVRNQLVRSRVDANSCNFSRDSLAKSLYTRTVATIVRRANSLKRLGSNSGTLSSDSADSVHNQAEVASQHASTVGTAGSKASKSMTALNNAVRHATDGFIGILDMFGFEDVRPSHLEQLCINLCAETMQHFYNTHIFKASIESTRDEGIQSDWEVEYVDNVPCIDLISSLKTGLLSMLDVECSVRGTVESYVGKVTSQHKTNPRLLPPEKSTVVTELRSFSIMHYAGKVIYDATEFLDTNKDILSDDLVAAFHKHRCSFGFASHLFSSELKILGAGGMEPSPRGISFRISPTSNTELLNGDEPVSTLTQDFHTRLDILLRTLVHAKPHFIRCIKMNQSEQPDLFDRHIVSKQLRAFQVLETVNLMVNGYPHRMRFKAFNARYKMLGPFHQLSRTDERAVEDCQLILDCFDNSVASCNAKDRGNVSISWAVGKRHIFLSEGARQQLELFRSSARTRSATMIQSTWRGFHCRQRWPILRQGFHHHRRFNMNSVPDIPPNLPPPNPHPFTNGSSFLNNHAPTHPLTSTLPRQYNTNNATHFQHNLGPPPPLASSYLNSGISNSKTTPSSFFPQGNHINFHPGYPSGTSTLRHGGGSHTTFGPPPPSQSQSQSLPQLQGQTQLSPSSSLPVPAPRREASTSNPEMHLGPSHPSSGSVSVTSSLSPPILPPIIPSNSHPIATATTVTTNGGGGTHSVCSSVNSNNSSGVGVRPPRPQPISGTPPPEQERCDPKLVQQTCSMFGLDMARPPPLPPSRSYTVTGNTKCGYPQTRVMKMTYPDEGTPSDIRLLKGETVTVVGTSPRRRGHLMVEVKNRTLHVPFQYLELKTPSEP